MKNVRKEGKDFFLWKWRTGRFELAEKLLSRVEFFSGGVV